MIPKDRSGWWKIDILQQCAKQRRLCELARDVIFWVVGPLRIRGCWWLGRSGSIWAPGVLRLSKASVEMVGKERIWKTEVQWYGPCMPTGLRIRCMQYAVSTRSFRVPLSFHQAVVCPSSLFPQASPLDAGNHQASRLSFSKFAPFLQRCQGQHVQ